LDRSKCYGEGGIRYCEEGDFEKMEVAKAQEPAPQKTRS
jgi:hypothetical protein